MDSNETITLDPNSFLYTPVTTSDDFFGLAYGLAGFDGQMTAVVDCVYPSASIRHSKVRIYAGLTSHLVRDARFDAPWRRTGDSAYQKEIGGDPFETYLKMALKDIKQGSDVELALTNGRTSRAALKNIFTRFND